MSTTPKKADGTTKKAAPNYLSDTFTTDDGIEVPPPTRPMGPRRLSRYYDEAADYLRAVARGDEELPPIPMFMGKVEGLELKADPSATLAGLSQMGNISTDEEELDIDYDQNQVTVVEDPLGHIGQQILGEPDDGQPVGPDQIDFAAAPIEIGSDSDFISIEELAEETDQQEEEPVETAEADEELTADTEADESSLEGAEAPESADTVAEDTADQSDTVAEATPVIVETSALQLPSPVRAIDAQGLDLTELDRIAPLARNERTLASETASAVESDSSEENNQVPEGYVIADSEDDIVSDSYEEDLPQEHEASVTAEDKQDHESALAVSKDMEATETTEASSSEEPRKGGAVVAVVGLFLLLAALILVWVVFYS